MTTKIFNMDEYSPSTTPLPSGLMLSTEDCPATLEAHEMKNIPYYEVLGSLM